MILRRHPSDFIVEERLSPAFTTALRPSGPGHALYRLTKTSLTTPDATLFLARALQVKPGLLQHAGLKDKHAVTSQHISVPWKQTTPPPPTATGERGSTSWSATLLGFSPRRVEAADIDSNAFTIIIRDLTPAAITEMDRRISLLTQPSPSALRLPPSAPQVPGAQRLVSSPPSLLFTNYFGDQRFGSARHHQGFAAQHLIRGDFETALKLLIATPARKDSGPRRTFTRLLVNAWTKWSEILPKLPKLPERRAVEVLATKGHEADFKAAFAALPNFLQQMAVDAFQSWIWNAVAREWINKAFSPQARLDSDDDFGTMTFPYAAATTAETCSLQIPMLTVGLVPKPPWETAAQTVLAQLDPPLSISNFQIPGLRRPAFGDGTRHLLSAALDFAALPAEPDDSDPTARRRHLRRTVSFTLSRGSYATTVLRAIAQ